MYTIIFTHQQLQILSDALSRMPYGVVADLINSINTQLADKTENEKKPQDLKSKCDK